MNIERLRTTQAESMEMNSLPFQRIRWFFGCFMATCVGCGLVGSASCHAQFALPAADPFGEPVDVEENQKKLFEEQLEIRIDEIDRVCKLEAAQLKKLKTAAKGAVSHAMSNWKKQATPIARGFAPVGNAIRIAPPIQAPVIAGPVVVDDVVPLPVDEADNEEAGAPENEPADDKPEAVPPDEDLPPAIAAVGNIVVAGAPVMRLFGSQPGNVQHEKIWKHTVKSVLSAEQHEKLQAADKERVAFRRETCVRNKVRELDQQLRLAPNQRKQVMQVVDRVLGPAYEREQGVGMVAISFGNESYLELAHLQDILTPTQVERFKRRWDRNDPFAPLQLNAAVPRFMPVPALVQQRDGAFLGAALASDQKAAGNDVTIKTIVPDGPAEKAGLKAGDVLQRIDDEEVTDLVTFIQTIREKTPGDEVQIVYTRDGEEAKATVTLQAQP